MRTIQMAVACVAVLIATAGQVQAAVIFGFRQSGGNVLMQSSGTLNTANLVPVGASGWGGVGVETNSPPESDIMGDTTMGGINTAFRFNGGTDLTPWVGNMFTISNFGWSSSGTTQFTTYFLSNGFRTPGIGIGSEDLIGSLWTPNVSWSKPGTLASLGLTVGTYTITDATTSEFISIQIGDQVGAVPEPASLAIFGIGACVVGLARRRRREKQ